MNNNSYELSTISKIIFEQGRQAAEMKDHGRRITRLERRPKRSMHRGDYIQIGIGLVSLLWAVSGRISWAEAFSILLKASG